MKTIIILTLMLIKGIIGINAHEQKTCNFFLIKETLEGVVIEKVILKENEIVTFDDASILSYVMVFEPGSKSGEFIKADDKIFKIKAGLSNGEIIIKVLNKDGAEREMPPINVEKAKTLSTRINITGHNNYKKAYRIDNYEKISIDEGPVIDIFSGQIPIGAGDYSFLTETHNANIIKTLSGISKIENIHNWMVVDCLLPGGISSKFIIDFGAETTVMEEHLLVNKDQVNAFNMVEYSSEGTKISNAMVTGGTGTVDNIKGVTTLERFEFGNILLKDQKVTILSKFPEAITKYGISGIIGRDILERAAGIKITDLNSEDEASIEFLKSCASAHDADHKLKYKRAGGHFFIDGSIKDRPASFLIDTGAGKMFIDKDFIDNGQVPYTMVNDEVRTASGLDGKGLEYKTVAIDDINIGGIQIPELEFEVMDLFVFKSIGLQNEAVLLGMDFFNTYDTILFNYSEEQLLLWY